MNTRERMINYVLMQEKVIEQRALKMLGNLAKV